MTSLDRIEIEGYKSIRKLDLELRPLNILIGANGAGKSNFMSALKLLNQIAERKLQVFVGQSGGADRLLRFGQKVTEELSIEVEFGKYKYLATLTPSSDETLFFSYELFSFRQDSPLSQIFIEPGKGHKETSHVLEMSQDNDWVRKHILDLMSLLVVYHFPDTSESSKVKMLSHIDDNVSLRSDASNLVAYLYLLRERHTRFYDLIVETVRLAAPFFDDFVLRPSPLNPDTIRLEWREKGSDSYFNANMLSDGTLRFICLATLLLQPNPPSTIIIDEPELGLHPYAITLLANLLSSAATKTQIIVSTQSVSLIDHFEPEDIIVVERENQESVFKRLSTSELEQWLESYSLGELWEKNVIGGRP